MRPASEQPGTDPGRIEPRLDLAAGRLTPLATIVEVRVQGFASRRVEADHGVDVGECEGGETLSDLFGGGAGEEGFDDGVERYAGARDPDDAIGVEMERDGGHWKAMVMRLSSSLILTAADPRLEGAPG